jgi:hypothetical protein
VWLTTHLKQGSIGWVWEPYSHWFPKAISAIYHTPSHWERVWEITSEDWVGASENEGKRKIIEINISGHCFGEHHQRMK